MKQNQNKVYSGWKANGFLALILILIALGGGIALAIYGSYAFRAPLDVVAVIVGVVLAFVGFISLFGFMMLEPNEARVLLFFGNYRGNLIEAGFWWVNPFMSKKQISLRSRNLNAEPIKVNDKQGNPIMIGLVLVWKIREEGIYKAVFDIDAPVPANGIAITASDRMRTLENFVSVQSDAALRQVAGIYSYDNNNISSEEVTLRSNADAINEELERRLTERLAIAGIEVVEARINYLAYAPEIAAVMLRRQQADAIISAREKIVEGAVSMVKMAIDKLSEEEVVELDEERKAAMVSNLLVVLCGDESAQPVVNTGTLHH